MRRCLWLGLRLALGLALAIPAPSSSQATGPAPTAAQRVVLITGSTSGLGREVARSLAADGDYVIIHGRSEERGQALVDEINTDSPGSARFYRANSASGKVARGA